MNLTVYMVCGVPGSGKTWVCDQLTHKFNYVKHDDFIIKGPNSLDKHKDVVASVIAHATKDKPVLLDCPFAERELKQKIESVGFRVKPFFIVEPVAVVQARYWEREKRDLPQASVTRAVTIRTRAEEWQAPYGPAALILDYLQREIA